MRNRLVLDGPDDSDQTDSVEVADPYVDLGPYRRSAGWRNGGPSHAIQPVGLKFPQL